MLQATLLHPPQISFRRNSQGDQLILNCFYIGHDHVDQDSLEKQLIEGADDSGTQNWLTQRKFPGFLLKKTKKTPRGPQSKPSFRNTIKHICAMELCHGGVLSKFKTWPNSGGKKHLLQMMTHKSAVTGRLWKRISACLPPHTYLWGTCYREQQ